jgi:hypothetical protein
MFSLIISPFTAYRLPLFLQRDLIHIVILDLMQHLAIREVEIVVEIRPEEDDYGKGKTVGILKAEIFEMGFA